uniref:hypothetical protein n=1 Tax=Streptomyces sp. NRRL S-813 TaxID=1463919 RepID=UPI00131DB178
TVPEPSAPRPPDLVDRNFTASRPDELWVADMTYWWVRVLLGRKPIYQGLHPSVSRTDQPGPQVGKGSLMITGLVPVLLLRQLPLKQTIYAILELETALRCSRVWTSRG